MIEDTPYQKCLDIIVDHACITKYDNSGKIYFRDLNYDGLKEILVDNYTDIYQTENNRPCLYEVIKYLTVNDILSKFTYSGYIIDCAFWNTGVYITAWKLVKDELLLAKTVVSMRRKFKDAKVLHVSKDNCYIEYE